MATGSFLVPTDGTSRPERIPIRAGAGLPEPHETILVTPEWSPDGSLIAFDARGRGVFVVRPDGTHLRRLADGVLPTWSPNVSWSSDGSRIALVSHDGGAITVVKPDGTDATTAVRSVQGTRPRVLGPTRPLWQPSAGAR
jgi:hypothetical protein